MFMIIIIISIIHFNIVHFIVIRHPNNYENLYLINIYMPLVMYILVIFVAHYSQSNFHVVCPSQSSYY
jgi:hypothetical protein